MKALYNIEVASDCNLRCFYCPSPHLRRVKQLMPDDVWERCLYWLKEFRQESVHLNGLGEPLLHPKLVEWTAQAHRYVPKVHLSTNGVSMTPELAKGLKDAGLWYVTISRHAPKAADAAAAMCADAGLSVSFTDPIHGIRHNWAGEAPNDINYPPEMHAICSFMRDDEASVLADGRMAACCIDANGVSAQGSVFDDLRQLRFEPFKLCLTCHHKIPENVFPGWQARLEVLV